MKRFVFGTLLFVSLLMLFSPMIQKAEAADVFWWIRNPRPGPITKFLFPDPEPAPPPVPEDGTNDDADGECPVPPADKR